MCGRRQAARRDKKSTRTEVMLGEALIVKHELAAFRERIGRMAAGITLQLRGGQERETRDGK